MRIVILYSVALLLGISSCKKKTKGSMMVIKGCEGTYLRYNELDYTICNEYSLDQFENGAMISATILRDDKCVSDVIHCQTVHAPATAEGNYKVTKASR